MVECLYCLSLQSSRQLQMSSSSLNVLDAQFLLDDLIVCDLRCMIRSALPGASIPPRRTMQLQAHLQCLTGDVFACVCKPKESIFVLSQFFKITCFYLSQLLSWITVHNGCILCGWVLMFRWSVSRASLTERFVS